MKNGIDDSTTTLPASTRSVKSLPLTTTIPFVSSGWLALPLHLLPFATLHYTAPFLYLQGCLILPHRFLFLGGGHGERGVWVSP
jgi:hypothetical protein